MGQRCRVICRGRSTLEDSRHSVEACLLGILDVKDPSTVPREMIEAWVKEEIVRYLGETTDVRPALADA